MRVWIVVIWLSVLTAAPAAYASPFADPFATYAETVAANAPEAYWRLGETSGTTAADATGHGHTATLASAAEQRTRSGALPADADGALTDARVWYASSYDLLRAPAAGLPGGAGARTLEAWVLTDNTGPAIATWGDFGVALEERAIVAAGKRLSLPVDDDRRITDSRWHHIVVTYADGTLTGYLDGAAIASATATLNTVTNGTLVGARIPAGASVAYDELAIYPRALDAATIAAHFTASGNTRPAAPTDVAADAAPGRITATWPAAAAIVPGGQRAVDHYVVEARHGGVVRAAQATEGAQATATLSGLAAGDYELSVRAVNGFGEGPAATRTVTVDGSATYAAAVSADAPELYWRLGETSGTRVADASGHGHVAAYSRPANERTRTGALPGDPDSAVADGVVWYGSSYDLIRAPLAAGLPSGARTVEAWVWSDNVGARLVNYGGFEVTLDERAITAAGKRIALGAGDDRRITDARWHHIAVTYADGRVTAYLDGAALGGADVTLDTPTTGELLAARVPAGATVAYDELAIYPRALDAATIAAHFNASENAVPAAPPGLTVTPAANRVDVTWSAPAGAAPSGQRLVDDYLVEARQNGVTKAAQAVDGTKTAATLSGLPAGAYTLAVRAVNGFGEGADSTTDVTVDGAATYAGAVIADQPELYWRLGEKSGTRVADATGHGHVAAYNRPANERTRTGALPADADAAMADGVVWYGSSYDLIRAPLTTGLPTGAAARTVEAWVWSDNGGARLVNYGGFEVTLDERAITAAGTRHGSGSRRRPPDHRRALASHRATYDGATVRGYLDGALLDSAAVALEHPDDGRAARARIPAGATVAYDELAVYPRALDAATVAAHFAASGNARPAAPATLQAEPAANRVAVTWTAPQGAAPAGQRLVDHYVVEARRTAPSRPRRRSTAPRRPPRSAGSPPAPTRSPSAPSTASAKGRDATADATVAGPATYAGAVLADQPELYWRLGEKSGTRVADASGHGHVAAYNRPANERTRTGALPGDPDSRRGGRRGLVRRLV